MESPATYRELELLSEKDMMYSQKFVEYRIANPYRFLQNNCDGFSFIQFVCKLKRLCLHSHNFAQENLCENALLDSCWISDPMMIHLLIGVVGCDLAIVTATLADFSSASEPTLLLCLESTARRLRTLPKASVKASCCYYKARGVKLYKYCIKINPLVTTGLLT